MNESYLFQSKVGQIMQRYLSVNQTLGRQFRTELLILKHLDKFLSLEGRDLTLENFNAWLHTKQNLSSTGRREWMRVTRNFCLYRQRTEPYCFIPDLLQFPKRGQPIQPYIFTEPEIIHLLEAIQKLKFDSKNPLRKETYRLGLILLYTTGLRRGELVRLTVKDYNSIERTLLIQESKFHKSRLLPLSPDAWAELEILLKKRRKLNLSTDPETPLLWHSSEKIGSYSKTGSWKIFHSLFHIANIRTASGKIPRVHDLRHTFAVHVLLRWYREGADVQSKLPILATYMGHVSIASTQYYLRFIEEVANSANALFEKHYGSLVVTPTERGAS